MKRFEILFILFSIFLIIPNAQAIPEPGSLPDPMMPMDFEKSLNDVNFTAEYDFRGIVSLNNCSGSLVRFRGSLDDDAAMVLTNGHCVSGMVDPGEHVERERSRRRFGILDQNANTIGHVRAKELLYATMTGTDMAIYRLEKTFKQIRDEFGIEALNMATDYAEPGTPMEVISGYWKRGYTCKVEKVVYELREAGWVFSDSIRYSRPGCQVIGGTSGSPIVQAGTRLVIGVNNTGNTRGRNCTMNNPCEVDRNGKIKAYKGYSYGQQTSWVYSCLDDERTLNLQKPGCELTH